MGAVLIDGVKGCGKTATALRQARSAVRLDIDNEALRLAAIDPSTLLEGERPHLIDEWQRGPAVVWDLVSSGGGRSCRQGPLHSHRVGHPG